MMKNRSEAEIIIVGGGVLGCAVAYHLAQAGFKDVLLLEKETIAGLTTQQAAGQVGQIRNSVAKVQAVQHTVESLEALQTAGYDPGWHQVGSLRLSLNEARDREFEQLLEIAHQAELEAALLSPEQFQAAYPHFDTEQIRSVLWCSSDGWADPVQLTRAYLQAATDLGVSFYEGVTVYQILLKAGKVAGVETDCGIISCQTVVNAAGFFSAQIATLVGVELPLIPIRHSLAIVDHLPGIGLDHPVVRLPDFSGYIRPGEAGLLIGKMEAAPLHLTLNHSPLDFRRPHIPVDGLGLQEQVWALQTVLPQLAEVELKGIQKGTPIMTPDGDYVVGGLAEVQGFILASGCNLHGIAGSASIAQAVVDSVTSHHIPIHLSPHRFTETAWERSEAIEQAKSVYANYYTIMS